MENKNDTRNEIELKSEKKNYKLIPPPPANIRT